MLKSAQSQSQTALPPLLKGLEEDHQARGWAGTNARGAETRHPTHPAAGSCGETLPSLAGLPLPFCVGMWLSKAEKISWLLFWIPWYKNLPLKTNYTWLSSRMTLLLTVVFADFYVDCVEGLPSPPVSLAQTSTSLSSE